MVVRRYAAHDIPFLKIKIDAACCRDFPAFLKMI
jgi:hypothetical protein